MDVTVLLVIATSIAVFIGAAVEVAKTTLNITNRFLPITSVVVGILIGAALHPFSDYPIYTMMIAGAIAGLSASGGFDFIKALRGDKQ